MTKKAAMTRGKAQRILDASMNLFARQGINRTSIDQITQEADIAKGTFYLYFDSREKLVNEVTRRCLDSFIKQMDAGLDQEGSYLRKVKRRVRNVLWENQTNPVVSKILRQMHQPFSASAYKTLPLAALYEADYKLISEGISSGEFRQMPVDLVYMLYAGAVEGLYSYFLTKPELLHQEDFISQCLDMLDGILCQHSSID